MAIRKRKDSYQVYWNNPYTLKRESETFYTLKEAQKKDALIQYQLKFERELFKPAQEEETAKARPSLTVNDAVTDFLKEKVTTKKSLVNYLDLLKSLLKVCASAPLDSVDDDTIKKVYTMEVRKKIKAVTLHKRMKGIEAFFKWCVDNELLESVPTFPKLPKGHYKKFVPPTEAEVAAILKVAPKHIKRIVIFGTQFGLRIGQSELYKLKWDDVDLKRRVVRVQAARKNPEEEWREVPIRDELVEVLSRWKESDSLAGIEYVINWHGHKLASIKRSWTTTLRNAGITRNIRPYDLRHAFATEALAHGVEIGTVARLMGHTNPSTTYMYYQHVMTEQKKRAVEALPHVPSFMCHDET